MNSINITGRLTARPELRRTQSGKDVCSFVVAVDRPFTRDTADFIACVAWGQRASYLDKYGDKGMRIGVNGVLASRKWEDNQGNKRIAWEVIANSVELLESRKDGESRYDEDGYKHGMKPVLVEEEGENDDGELPF